MTEVEALRHENSILQKRITAQRKELGRLYGEVGGLSTLVRQYAGDYWKLRKQVELQASQLTPQAGAA